MRTNRKYYVSITEQLDVNHLIVEEKQTFPMKTITTVDIKDDDGNQVANWTIKVEGDHDPAGVKASRTITVSDKDQKELACFKMYLQMNKYTRLHTLIDEIYLVEDGNETKLNDININKAGTFEVNGQKYYFDPDVMMIMPLPESNLKFENTPGLLFRKVDDSGHEVIGANIQLLADGEPITDESIWSWDETTSSKLIDVSKLSTDVIYKFYEEKTPNKYETSVDIYFKKLSDTEIRYWTKGDREGTILNLNEQQEIRMVDKKIVGVKLSLSKLDFGTGSHIDGAVFSLYASDGTLIFSGFNGNGDIFENEEFKAISNSYAHNGYLKPGVYYLTEDVIPEHPTPGETYENPGRIYFTVTDDFILKSGYANDITLYPKYNGNNMLHLYTSDSDKTTDIKNVTGFKFTIQSWNRNPNLNFYTTGFKAEGFANKCDVEELDNSWLYTYSHTFDSPVDIDQFELQNWTDSKVVCTSAEITTSDGKTYIYSSNSSGNEGEFGNQNPMLDVDGTTLVISNKTEGETKNISAKKSWKGDKNFESFRGPITVKLYQSKTKLTDPKNELTEDMAYKDENGRFVTAELNEANEWKVNWTELPSKYTDEDENKHSYYYYIKEIDVPEYYTDSYSIESDGTLLLTNTFESIELNVEKVWDTTNISRDIVPNNIVLKLQWKNDAGDWEDVPDHTINLIKSYDFKGTFKNLPAGKTYRILENNVPNGWKIKTESNEASKNGDTLSIENEPKLGSLQVEKGWLGDDGKENKRPDSIKLGIYRATQTLWPKGQTAEEVQEDYARLLQYALYFYDGNMCGNEVNENSAYPWRENCHTTDEITGGFHDAGDHVMFGLPAGFSASNLGWSLYEFRDDYDKLGQTAHTKVITDYYSDFFMKCVKLDENGDVKELLVQKGHGNTDHAYWGIPEGQPDRSKEMYWVSNTGSDIAAEYAAALTLSYLNFHKTDEERYGKYLEMAEKLFAYSIKVDNCLNEKGINIDEKDTSQYPGYYSSDDYKDDQAWAAAWLAVATKEDSYRSKCQSLLNGGMYDWGGYHWNNVKYGAMCVNAAYLGGSWDGVKQFVNTNCTGTGYLNQNEWGCSRYNTGYQTIALAAANHAESGVNAKTVADWCKNQMNFILGDNDFNTCFVTNFSENSTKKPHYRAGSGQVFDMKEKDDETIIDSYEQDVNRLIGGLVGGPTGNNDNYNDKRSDYQKNEVSSDYNANLVGAAAGLYHFFGTGSTYEIPGVKVQYLQQDTENEAIALSLPLSTSNLTSVMSRKAVMYAATVEESYTFDWNSKSFGTNYSLPSEIADKTITKVDLFFNSTNLNGAFTYNNWGGQKSLSYTSDKKLTFEIGTVIQNFAVQNWYGDWNVEKIVFYYESENSFKVTPENNTILLGDSTKLNIVGITNIQNITWDNSNVKWNSSESCWYYTADKIGKVTLTGVSKDGKEGNCEINVQSFTVTPSTIKIPEGGNGTLKANGRAEWTTDSDVITLEPNAGGTECKVIVRDYTADTITITAKHNSLSNASATVKITAGELQIINSPIKVHENKTASVELNLKGGNQTFSVADTNIATVSGSTVTGKSVGETTITATRNGVTAEGIIQVIEPISISGSNVMNIGETTALTAVNNVGDVAWSTSDENIATVDENGIVTSKSYGSVTITATDSDGTQAEFKINIQMIGVIPQIPSDAELVQIITLSEADDWSKVINYLPLTDEYGDAYYYYIAELDNDGETARIIEGKGASYIPVSYGNNGSALSESDKDTVLISVTNKMTEEIKGVMPMTGGHGTRNYYIFGGCIVSLAGVILIYKKRTKKNIN